MEPADSFEPNVPGIYRIPAATYHGAPGFSNSMASHMDPPAMLPVYLTEERKVTAEMFLGTIIHQRLLEPDQPIPKIVQQPAEYPGKEGATKWHNGAKYCKEWHQAQKDAGRVVLTEEQMTNLVGCIESLKQNPTVQALFSKPGESELSLFTEFDGVLCKSRLDYVPPSDVCRGLVDVKKVQEGNAQRETFIALAVKRGYHRQAAAYLDAWNYWFPDDPREHMLFVVVEEQPPYLTNVIPMGPRTIERGRELNRMRRVLYRQCKETGVWPGWPMSLKPIEASEYLLDGDY